MFISSVSICEWHFPLGCGEKKEKSNGNLRFRPARLLNVGIRHNEWMNQACRGKLSPYGCGLWARGGNELPCPLLPFNGREPWPCGSGMCPLPLVFGKEPWPFEVGDVRWPLPLPLPLASSSSSCCVSDFFFSARRMWRSCDPHMSWEEDRGSVTGRGVEDLYKGKRTLRFGDFSEGATTDTHLELFVENSLRDPTHNFYPKTPGEICSEVS